jgi:hypothetical protein
MAAGAAVARPHLGAAAATATRTGRAGRATATAAFSAAAVAFPAAIARVPAIPRIGARGVGRLVIVGLPFAAYLAMGLVFSLGGRIITGDAWSRVGNGYYMLFSRDPHLAAIGFVWNPLPSVVDAILLPLAAIWRPIVSYGIAGNLMSAAFMALAVREIWLWLRELEVSKPMRIGLIAAFALHPLIALYGSNGMSEAPFLFFLLVAGRNVSAWIRTSEVSRLAVAGFGLALAYLTRYEAVAPIAALTLVTAGIAFVRSPGTRRDRAMTGLADALIVAAPAAGAFVLWALASWLIVGSPFDTFTSVYGNTSQVGLSLEAIRESTGSTPAGAIAYLSQQALALEPMLPGVVVLAAAIAVIRRDLRILVPLAVFGSVVALSGLLFMAGGSFGWLRFSIGAIPLVVMSLGIALARDGGWRPAWPARLAGPLAERVRNVVRSAVSPVAAVISAALVGLALVAVPVSTNAMFDSRLAREEAPKIAGLVAGDRLMPGERRQFLVAGEVARYLDAQNLPDGSVVIDVALGFWIVLQSENPKQFVITPDRDFERIVADPAAFDARYLIASPPYGLGGLAALERAHPGLYVAGAGIGELVRTFGDEDQGVAWRIYEVITSEL